jgi:phosphatidylglycerophosphatase A
MKNFLANTLVTFLGVGYIRLASGTWASLLSAVILYWFWPSLELEWKILASVLVFLIGWVCSEYVEKRDHTSDPSMIVIDEVVGMMIASLLLPQVLWQWIIAFFVFRFFDIFKIWPASFFDRKKGGFSIMFDDVVAALFSLVLLMLFL